MGSVAAVTSCTDYIQVWSDSITVSTPYPDLPHPGARLQWLAAQNGLNQEQLGDLIGADQGGVSKIYKDKQTVTVTMAEKAFAAFAVPRGWLLFGEGEPWGDIRKAYERGRQDAMGDAAELLSRLAASRPDPATLGKLLLMVGGTTETR